MTDWKCKINIKKHIEKFGDEMDKIEETSKPDFKQLQNLHEETKKNIVKELKKCKQFRSGLGSTLVQRLDMSPDMNETNTVLEEIYDYADEERVWLS